MVRACAGMNRRKIHRLTGIFLLLPFVAWASTAIFFLVRPAYDQAYEQLQVRHQPLPPMLQVSPQDQWQEIRLFSTVLGNHLLVRESGRWQHLNADTLAPWPQPETVDLIRLLDDAFAGNPERYGRVVNVENNTAVTDRGIQIGINWDSMSLSQSGRDTYWINKVYDIHYLRWTGYRPFDQVFGLLGLLVLMYMTYSGARMAFVRR